MFRNLEDYRHPNAFVAVDTSNILLTETDEWQKEQFFDAMQLNLRLEEHILYLLETSAKVVKISYDRSERNAMKKIYEWIVKHKVWTVIVCASIFSLPL